MCRIVQDVGILKFDLCLQNYFGTINFCRMSQDVGKLRCRIAQVPVYIHFLLKSGIGEYMITTLFDLSF